MLVDSHCHLDFDSFDEDRAAVIARAHAAGVGTLVTISTSLAGFEKSRAIAEEYDTIWCSVGIHPHNTEGVETTTADLLALADHPRVVGIGETGLDFYYDNAPKEDQIRQFRIHIAAARESGLPLIVHTRDADRETVEILHNEYRKGAFTGLIHCFSTSRYMAEKALEIGFYISLSGIVTFKAAGDLRETVRGLPPERLLVETDSPYLAPVPHRGKRNEPAFTADTARFVAAELGLEEGAFAATTTDNFFALFTRAGQCG